MKKETIRANYSSNVKKIRKQKKLTQTEFANQLGLTRQCYSKVEEGCSATFDIAVKISEISGFSLDSLIKAKI